jgi:hypothetical protein
LEDSFAEAAAFEAAIENRVGFWVEAARIGWEF